MTYRTEAQDIVEKLRFSGMQYADMARSIGVRAQAMRDIARGKSQGGAYVEKLRGLYIHMQSSGQLGTSAPADPKPTPVPPPEPAAPRIALEVDDAPRDERSTAARLRDSIKEAMLGGSTASVNAPAARGGSRKGGSVSDAQADFVEQIVPILALVTAILIESQIPAPYRVAAPTEEEAGAICRPLLRILARQLEIAGRLSDTALDLLAFAGASADYGWRMFKTVQAIRQERAQYVDADGGAGNGAGGVEPGRASPSGAHPNTASNGHSGGRAARVAAALGLVGDAGTPAQSGHRDGGRQVATDDAAGRAAIERLLAADAIGSKRLGVL